jgi:hypothetical protein
VGRYCEFKPIALAGRSGTEPENLINPLGMPQVKKKFKGDVTGTVLYPSDSLDA